MFLYIKYILFVSVFGLGILLSSGCEKSKPLSDLNSPAYIESSKQANFTIAGCHIFYKGKELPPFTGTKPEQAPAIQSWIDALGDDYVKFSSNIYIWKELGFRVYTRREDENKVQTLTIIKYVPEPEYIELEKNANDLELLEDMRKFYGDNSYEESLPQRIIDAKNEVTIYSHAPHPKPVWFNGAIIEDHFNKEQFNQQMAQYRQKLNDGYESAWGQGSGSQFFEGYSVWRQSSFSKCDGGWGFETLIRVEQEFAPDNVISAINIGPDR